MNDPQFNPDPTVFSTENEMMKVLTDYGVSTSDARLALDMANHARVEAMNALRRIGDTAPEHLKHLVHALALDSVSANMEVETTRELQGRLLALGIAIAAGVNFKRGTTHGE